MCFLVCITTCGKVATLNNTYWGNPGYPSTYSTAGQCSISVQKTSDICQFRYKQFPNLVAELNSILFFIDWTSSTLSSTTQMQLQLVLKPLSVYSISLPLLGNLITFRVFAEPTQTITVKLFKLHSFILHFLNCV